MCLGIPGKVLRTFDDHDVLMGKVDFGGVCEQVCLEHVPGVKVQRGLKKPHECPAFGARCTPQTPLGATMVSSEGACAAYNAYGRHLEASRAPGTRLVQLGVARPQELSTGSHA